jgi:hypothetical protein
MEPKIHRTIDEIMGNKIPPVMFGNETEDYSVYLDAAEIEAAKLKEPTEFLKFKEPVLEEIAFFYVRKIKQ